MPLYSLTVCEWNGSTCESNEISNPSWQAVADAIRRLDNDCFNDLYLQRDSDPEHFWLSIGGGAGRYLITGAAEEGQFPTVVSLSSDDDATEKLVVGGQCGIYPKSWIHDLSTALAAAKHFFDHGTFGGELKWKQH